MFARKCAPRVRDRAQQPVAADVAAVVVHDLEVVDVEQRQRKNGPGRRGPVERLGQHAVDAATIQQAGQRIDLGIVGGPHEASDNE